MPKNLDVATPAEYSRYMQDSTKVPLKSPQFQEAWHVEDAQAETCIPSTGFIRDYIDYCKTTCDGAVWFQLGGILTALSVIGAKCDYHAEAPNGRYEINGLHLWSACVGLSGCRKSQSVKPALRILRNVCPKAFLPTDGSIEAVHDTLKDREGNGIFHRDELSTLFAQAKRSYSTGLIGWMLEAHNGGPTERVTKAGGSVEIPRVRLSILGNIPPTTLQQSISREDWRTGFLPRFLFWGARRVGYMPIASQDNQLEGALSHQLQQRVLGKNLQLVIPYEVGKPLTEWHKEEVDDKGHLMADELYSTLLRLRTKGFQIAAIYALARINHIVPNDAAVLVNEEDIDYAIKIMKLMKMSTQELFNSVGGTEEATQEMRAISHVARSDKANAKTVATALGISVRASVTLCRELIAQGLIIQQPIHTESRGRPQIRYTTTPDILKNYNAIG